MKTLNLLLLLLSLLTSTAILHAKPVPGWVIGWGINIAGEATGVPSSSPPNVPNISTGAVVVAGEVLSNAVAIAAGAFHALAVRQDGTVAGWGGNGLGAAVGFKTPYPGRASGLVRIGGQVLSNVTAVAVGRTHSLALKNDGTVVAWGADNFGQASVPAGLSNATAIAAGGNQSMALLTEGTVVSWGEGNKPPIGLSNVVAVSAAGSWFGADLALTRDGTVVQWALRGQPRARVVPLGPGRVVAVSAGRNYGLALREDGTVASWDFSKVWQAPDMTATDVTLVADTCITAGEQVLSNVVSIASGNGYSLALKSDGPVVSWGNPYGMRMAVPAELRNAVAIAAGENFCLAITTNASAFQPPPATNPPPGQAAKQ